MVVYPRVKLHRIHFAAIFWANFKKINKITEVVFPRQRFIVLSVGYCFERQLRGSKHFGSLFENYTISGMSKKYYNIKRSPQFYFWRDSNGNGNGNGNGNVVDLIDMTLGGEFMRLNLA